MTSRLSLTPWKQTAADVTADTIHGDTAFIDRSMK